MALSQAWAGEAAPVSLPSTSSFPGPAAQAWLETPASGLCPAGVPSRATQCSLLRRSPGLRAQSPGVNRPQPRDMETSKGHAKCLESEGGGDTLCPPLLAQPTLPAEAGGQPSRSLELPVEPGCTAA